MSSSSSCCISLIYSATSTTYGIIDKLTTTLDGNRITRVTDAGTNVTMPESADFKDYAAGSGTYTYNNYGTLTKDSQKGILHISYNFIHLPKELGVRNTNAVGKTYYTYSADGVKRQVKHLTSTNLSYTPVTGTGGDANFNVTRTTDFAGNVVYENGSLKRISTEGGYIEGGVWYYYLTDHLGNNRVVANAAGTVVQKTHYYPYGMAFAENTTAEQGLQPYKYNGKELDPMHGTNLYDYAARMMDPALGRFTSMDPLAEKYYDWSPYAYVANNPLRYVDPTGMAIDDPEEEIRKKSMLERLINSFNNLFSLSIDTSSPETINASANQLEANRQTVQQVTNTVNAVSEAISMAMPLSSMAEAAANASVGNTGAAWAAVPFAILDIATMGEGSLAKGGAKGGAIAFRYMTEAELNVIKNTKLLRGGNLGETFFTKDMYKSASKAQTRLALPNTPILRVEFEILNNPTLLRNGTKVQPAFGMSGGGSEFMTVDQVRVKLINWQSLGH